MNKLRLITLSAKSGNAESQNELGAKYLSGNEVKQNYSTAKYWFEKAIEKNHKIAYYNLGLMYSKRLWCRTKSSTCH